MPPTRVRVGDAHRRSGFTLLEVVVALTVLGVALAGVVGTQQVALQRWNAALQGARLRLELRSLADSVDRGLVPEEGHREEAWGQVRWGAAGPGISLEALDRDSVVVERLWTGGPRGGHGP